VSVDPREWGLYVITDRHQAGDRPLEAIVEAAAAGGARAFQLREKDLETRALCALAARLRAIVRRAGGVLLVNDRVDVALALDLDGVHLPQAGLPPAEARGLLGPARLVGVSCHSPAEARAAEADGADFATFGPVYDTPSKRAYGPPVGLDALRAARAAVRLPTFALGGVTAERVPEAIAAGADGVAVIAAVVAAADPGGAAASLLEAVRRAREGVRLADRGGWI
jgi:thiamine-phosphate pyrophosphorylase